MGDEKVKAKDLIPYRGAKGPPISLSQAVDEPVDGYTASVSL